MKKLRKRAFISLEKKQPKPSKESMIITKIYYPPPTSEELPRKKKKLKSKDVMNISSEENLK